MPGRADHVFDFQEFTKSLPADNVLEWTKMVEKWDDAAELAQDEAVAIHDDISPAMLIASGIDLETQQ